MRRIRLIMLATATAASAAQAADEHPLCPAPAPLPEVAAPAPERPGELSAAGDRARSAGAITILEGNAAVRRDERALGAERVRLDRESGRAEASGDVVLTAPGLELRAREGSTNMNTGTFDVDAARYRLPPVPAQGRAERLARDETGISTLADGTFSTCPAQAEAWHLSAEHVRLDSNTQQGTARNVELWFKGVPLFYSPWFRFPLGDERMSGFLAPTIGRSDDSGTEVSVPWYWNAAPNFDATLAPRWLERRGTQLQSEWRWLGPIGRWQLNNEYLPDDDLYGDDRVLTQLYQEGEFGAWRTEIDAARASDPDYFDDLGTGLSVSSQTHLRQRADLHWRGGAGRFRLRADAYQTLDQNIEDDDRPYERVPQATFTSGGRWGWWRTQLDSEMVRFEREPGDPAATRLRLTPAITWAAETPGWFFRPRLAVDHTSYRLEQVDTGIPEDFQRTLPIASVDTGLVLDRFGESYQQTLEPRAFYAYIPDDEDQNEIPLFDTGRYGFSFPQLFRERRFTGGDRVGDTNRLTLALTSRVLSRETGRELLRGSIGGIRHFDDRGVTLRPNEEPETGERSDLIGELAASPTPQLRAQIAAQWDPQTDIVSKWNTALRYRGPGGGVANVGYRERRDGLDEPQQEQVDVSFAWPVSPRWQLVAGNNYSLLDERSVESVVGAEYNSCCWRLRTVAREHITNNGEDTSRGIYLELVLKGLGGVGDDTGGLLERAILGYRDPESTDSDLAP
ncbi:MAG: LPS assembly protein LptD [Halofilum sp. (in: g-proteobacteria)]